MVQVKERLRDHTAPLDMLCLKLLDGASVDPQCSAVPGVSFSKQQLPSYAAELMHSVHAPELARLAESMQPGPAGPAPTQVGGSRMSVSQVLRLCGTEQPQSLNTSH